MRRRGLIQEGLAACLAVLLAAVQAASAAESGPGPLLCLETDMGGREASVSGSQEKFEEYRDMRDGFLVNLLRLKAEGRESAAYLDLEAKNAARGDEAYRIGGGRYGKFRVSASFDRIPHNFGRGTLLLSGAGTGNLGISNAVQAALEAAEQTRAERGANPLIDANGEDSLQQGILRDLFTNTDPTTFKLDRERGSLSMDLNLTPEVKTWVKVTDERRKGLRQIGWGTYERYAQGGAPLTHTTDLFFVSGMQLAEPLDDRTTSVNAGAGLYKKAWSADLEYTFSEFKNQESSLVWRNPFRNTNATATAAAGAATSNAFNRGRFAQGQMSLPPSSRSHEIAASGSAQLPWRGRLAGALSLGWVNQNAPLLPYTMNSAIGGVGGAPLDVTGFGSLPAPRFRGEVRTLTQSYVLTARPVDRLGAKLTYRYYDYDNRSDRLVFPGYAAWGESFWRTVKNDTAGNGSAPVVNESASYTRHSAELGADYAAAQPVTLNAGTFWDHWRYRDARVERTHEVGGTAGFAWRVGQIARAHGGYRFARRIVAGYRRGNQPNNPEALELTNYNWADRIRHRGNLGVGVTPNDEVSLGVDGSYQDDSLGARDRFGLKSQKSAVLAFDATYDPSPAWSVSCDYSRELRKSRMQNGAKDDAFNSAGSSIDDAFSRDSFNPLNYWNDEIAETVDTVALEATLRPRETLELKAGYSLSYSRMDFAASNPNAGEALAAGFPAGAKLANAAAQPWPSVVNRLHELRLGGLYRLPKDLRVGLNYLLTRYSLNDFSNAGPYLAGASVENSTRYLWTGADRYGYTAHVFGTHLAWNF